MLSGSRHHGLGAHAGKCADYRAEYCRAVGRKARRDSASEIGSFFAEDLARSAPEVAGKDQPRRPANADKAPISFRCRERIHVGSADPDDTWRPDVELSGAESPTAESAAAESSSNEFEPENPASTESLHEFRGQLRVFLARCEYDQADPHVAVDTGADR